MDATHGSQSIGVQERVAPPELMLELLRKMWLVREFEHLCIRVKQEGVAKGALHLCLGQEAVGVGACAALRQTDTITSTHRGHAHFLGKGADPDRVMAEILGRATGYGKGRAGHMLICDLEVGLVAATGIVGGMLPVAIGQAYAFQFHGQGRVVLTFFGDGAANEGAFGEALNLAALWSLPIVFLCENNGYGLTVPVEEHLAGDVVQRAAGYGIPGVKVDGNDAVAIWQAASAAVERAREGSGPTLIEARTYRMTGFSLGDRGGYQTHEEMEVWRGRDPIERLERLLIEDGLLTREDCDAMRNDARARVDRVREYAEASPFPDPTTVDEDVMA
jgi:TPP-dependent pyruvate/acetoin dehydrogenase alpha subunit